MEVEAVRDTAIINRQDELNSRAFEFLAEFQREKMLSMNSMLLQQIAVRMAFAAVAKRL